MKTIRLEEPRNLQHADIGEPDSPGPGQALVRTHRMGICGTDYSGYLGKMPFISYPLILGHELGVEVLEVGDGVTNVAVGEKCSVEPYMNCGTCYPCRRGNTNCCETLNVIGVMVDGGLCERFLIRADKLHPSEILSYEQLALVETLGIGCHATDRAKPKQGDHVLIIGAGPIGLATLEFTRLTGAEITVMDVVESRLEFCRETYGVPHTVLFKGDGSEFDQMLEITGGDKYAVVTDATGSDKSMSTALAYVAHTGSLVYLGITTKEISFFQAAMHKPELTIKSSRNALAADFTRIISLIEDGTINTGPWITHRTSFDDVIGEFETFTRPESGVIKAVIEVT
ncbi:MAG: zinc-binding alcohol dehydrogenase family protein [Planctomycetaceae bacterium]|jgi:2-desacetyl-2-hydroxyethyl bacteriochlorophyllide A dehydrogenase|nr:zinc-binding alcohol dehydrogenase family protein [Planctomycetaceae bacterium]MBT6486017.1 zinc-binding alcohol dehydrogenase family protein [Planctomycetaceae bacterium]MBT6493133.1 zinc-binding alcohol dehydrogenase family protein [Planctomycetaceae bacterium]